MAIIGRRRRFKKCLAADQTHTHAANRIKRECENRDERTDM